ncbi:MAG: hypothetical protein ACPGSD_13405 [Flavobacteriales bacterium]
MISRKLKKFGLISGLLTLMVSAHAQTEPEKVNTQETVEHIIPEFEITFPKTEYEVEKIENKAPNLWNILITNWLLEGKDENGPFMYFVAHNEFPLKLKELAEVDSNSLDVAFKAMLTSSAVKLGGFDFKFKALKYKGFTGMESTCNVFNGEGIIRSRVYKINNNIFIISAGGEKIDVKSVDAFLNSFEIKGKQPSVKGH